MKFLDKRLKILAAIVTLIVVALISRLVYLQIYQGEYFSKLADGNRIRLVSTSAPRGIIYDRNGVQLVNNRPAFTVELCPLAFAIASGVSPASLVAVKTSKLFGINARPLKR